jgi:hypothetical protein
VSTAGEDGTVVLPDPESTPISWEQLRRCASLAALSPAVLRELFGAADHHSFDAGQALITQGEPADGLLILLSGTAHALLRTDEGSHRIGSFAAGDVVGEMALVTREPRSASVIADSRVRALRVPAPAFDRLASRHFELGVLLTQLIADRLGQGTRDGFGGKTIEGFRIHRCLGRGGMSVVYRAEEISTGELVALKMMSYRLVYDPIALARFRREAELVQALEHENIARLKRLFPALHTYFLVMELCDGVDLSRLVARRGPLPEPQVRAILGQLARALEYIHQRGLVHRDLKPANAILTVRGTVKLTDFGIAIPFLDPGDQTRTADHTVMGTPGFMAPEQLSGSRVDARTDVYALGCLAYNLLAGRPLFKTGNLLQLLTEKLTTRVPPAAEIGPGISAELHEFIDRALRVDANERPASTAALVGWARPCDPPPGDLLEEDGPP